MALIVLPAAEAANRSPRSQILEIGLEARPGPLIHLDDELQGFIHGRSLGESVINIGSGLFAHVPLHQHPCHLRERHTQYSSTILGLDPLSIEPATAYVHASVLEGG
jgi:hypothetical protein